MSGRNSSSTPQPRRAARGDVTGVSRIKPLNNRRSATVSVLDVGSTKISCLIARLKPSEGDALRQRTHAPQVIGFSCTRSRGIKSGVVVDLDEAEKAIRHAVDAAERMAGMTIHSLIVNFSCGRVASESFSAQVAIGGRPVVQSDIQRVLAAGGAHSVGEGRIVVHGLPITYTLDGQRGIADPQGMVGGELGVDMHVVTADEAPLRNLELAVNRCHLELETIVATPYASGLAALVDDEAELGVALIDLGGGTTTLSVFEGGQFVHADAVPVGGHHVTLDIARGLSARVTDAERLKVRFGSVLHSVSDERDIITIPPVAQDGDDDAPNAIPRSTLTRIIRPRVEETLEMARDMLGRSGFSAQVGKRVVLTGGASQLVGLAETARRMLGRNIRLGRPLGIAGLPEVARSPAFSCVVGLAVYPQVATIEQFRARSGARLQMTGTDGYVARVGRWIRESF